MSEGRGLFQVLGQRDENVGATSKVTTSVCETFHRPAHRLHSWVCYLQRFSTSTTSDLFGQKNEYSCVWMKLPGIYVNTIPDSFFVPTRKAIGIVWTSIRYVTLYLRDWFVGAVLNCEQKPYPVFFFAPAETFSRIVWTQPEYIFAFQCAASNCGRTSIASVLTRYSLKTHASSNSVCISGTHLVQPLWILNL